MPHAGLWPSAWWNGLATEEGANWIDAVVWYLKHDFVLLLHRTAVTACYFSLYQFWHLNIFSWKRMSFSWKNFLYNKVSIYSHPNICDDLIGLNILIDRSFLFPLPRNHSQVCRAMGEWSRRLISGITSYKEATKSWILGRRGTVSLCFCFCPSLLLHHNSVTMKSISILT